MKHSRTIRGQSLLELLLALALATGVIVLAVSGAARSADALQSSEDALTARSTVRGCIDAVRSMRDDSFGDLSGGEYGLVLTDGSWSLLQSVEPGYRGPFVRLTNISNGTFDVTCTLTTESAFTDAKETQMSTHLTNWKENATSQESINIQYASASVASTSDALFDIHICNDGEHSKNLTGIRIAWEESMVLMSLVVDDFEVYGPEAHITSNEYLALPSIPLSGSSCISLTALTFDGVFDSGHLFIAATIDDELEVTRHVFLDHI